MKSMCIGGERLTFQSEFKLFPLISTHTALHWHCTLHNQKHWEMHWILLNAKCIVHWALCTMKCALCTVKKHCALQNVLCIVHCDKHCAHFILKSTVHCEMCTMHCEKHFALWKALCTVKCTLHCGWCGNQRSSNSFSSTEPPIVWSDDNIVHIRCILGAYYGAYGAYIGAYSSSTQSPSVQNSLLCTLYSAVMMSSNFTMHLHRASIWYILSTWCILCICCIHTLANSTKRKTLWFPLVQPYLALCIEFPLLCINVHPCASVHCALCIDFHSCAIVNTLSTVNTSNTVTSSKHCEHCERVQNTVWMECTVVQHLNPVIPLITSFRPQLVKTTCHRLEILLIMTPMKVLMVVIGCGVGWKWKWVCSDVIQVTPPPPPPPPINSQVTPKWNQFWC